MTTTEVQALNRRLIEVREELEEARAHVSGLEAFQREWVSRFGHLATTNPPDSIAAIDEVATLLQHH